MVSQRHELFKKRLTKLGMFDDDSDYDGMIGTSILELSEAFAKQGHSGMSAAITVELFSQLMQEYNDMDSPMWEGQDDGRG